MVKTTKTPAAGSSEQPQMQQQPLKREQICQYVWDRYIDNIRPKMEIDEEAALQFFEGYYAKHPLNVDPESFYYGILLYERAFADDANRARYLVKAKEVFESYRTNTGDTELDAVELRYEDTADIVEREGLEAKVKSVVLTAPEVEGMVLVPGGTFMCGEQNATIVLDSYYIDVTPVTNEQYRKFLEETNYRRPQLWEQMPELAEDGLPVTGVSWMDALMYCKWAGKSLPTAEQWEKAARGSQGNTYPWGEDEPTPERACYWDQIREPRLRPIASAPQSASPYGVRCMSGFVWEWTNTPISDIEGAQIVKGGSWADPGLPQFLSGWARNWANKKEKNELIGFRTTKRLESTPG